MKPLPLVSQNEKNGIEQVTYIYSHTHLLAVNQILSIMFIVHSCCCYNKLLSLEIRYIIEPVLYMVVTTSYAYSITGE